MLDNRKGEIDDQFTDRAWGEMRRLLDREMPVMGKRRRAALWFWPVAAAMLLLTGVIGWNFFRDGSEMTGDFSAVEVEQAAERPAVSPEGAKESAEFPETPQIPEHAASQDRDEEIAADQKNTASTISQAIYHPEESPAVSPERSETAIIVEPDAGLPENSPDLKTEGLENRSRLERMEVVGFLEGIQPSKLLTENSRENLFISELEKIPLKRARLTSGFLGIEAGAVAGGPGYSLGFTARTVSGERWQFHSGLSYSKYVEKFGLDLEKTADFNSLIEFDTESGNNPFPDNASVDPGTGFSNVNAEQAQAILRNQNLELHSLNLPVWAAYRPSPSFSLDAGVKVSYLLHAYRLWDEQNSLATQTSYFRSLLDAREGKSSEKVDMGKLNRWDLGFIAGASYHPAKRLRLSLHYHHGFTDLIRQDNLQAKRQYWQLSAGYYLK